MLPVCPVLYPTTGRGHQPHLAAEEIEAQRGEASFLGPHSQDGVELPDSIAPGAMLDPGQVLIRDSQVAAG